MKHKLAIAMFEWGAGLMIGAIPILSHILMACAGRPPRQWAWVFDILLMAIMTSGLNAVTTFTRLARGSIRPQQLNPHSCCVMAFTMITFALSGMMFGQVTSGEMAELPMIVPLISLACACAGSAYFEILLAISDD